MKSKLFSKKLSFSKQSVTRLGALEQAQAKGGATGEYSCFPCAFPTATCDNSYCYCVTLCDSINACC